MKFYSILALCLLHVTSVEVYAEKLKIRDISEIISKEEFSTYKDVAEFIDKSPKVTVDVVPSTNDVNTYGQNVSKSLTGSDCDRDGKMDDNSTCNAVFYKLWLKYKR